MSEKHYRQLRLEQREQIEEGLNANKSISAIAKECGAAPSTVMREILRNRRDDGLKPRSSSAWGNANTCAFKRECTLTSLCKHCTSTKVKRCSVCAKGKCNTLCAEYVEHICERIAGAPHVCNGCTKVSVCWLHRYRYSAKNAQASYKDRASETREGIDCTPEKLKCSEAILKSGLDKGQGLNHIYLVHADDIAFSKRSCYRHIHSGILAITPMNLPKMVRYKARAKKGGSTRSNIAAELLVGRTYADFCNLDEDTKASTVQCDCVEGPAEQSDAIFTMHFLALHFQIAFYIKSKDSARVVECLNWLDEILDGEFSTYFPILLVDRGCEFSDVYGMEKIGTKKRCSVYFTDPQRPDQKGHCEKNHVELRKVIPSGTSLANVNTWVLAEVMSHVNSSLRRALYGKSPMELAQGALPEELLNQLGYHLIAPDDVVLKPVLLNMCKVPNGTVAENSVTS